MKIPAAFCGGRFGPNGIGKIPKALGMYMDPNLSKSGKAETSSDFPLFASNFAFESFLEMYVSPKRDLNPRPTAYEAVALCRSSRDFI